MIVDKLNGVEKIVIGLGIIIFLSIIAYQATADNKHHHNVVNATYNSYLTEEYTSIVNKTISNVDNDGAIALSNGLSGFDCTFTTERWQVGGALGLYGNTHRPVIGGCKKFNKMLFKFTGGKNNNKWGGNVSVMFPLN